MEKNEKVEEGKEAREVKALTKALAAPFAEGEVKWKPQAVSGNRALAVAFVDARVIQDRLDDVVGSENWQDTYECLPDGAVVCRLRVRLGTEWITKTDVGGQSEQPDEGDRRKAAFSDALKRAAVKFGIGRYLYRLEGVWVGFDPQKKRLTETPRLPAWALPAAPRLAATPEPAPAKGEAEKKEPKKPAEKAAAGGGRADPETGDHLRRGLV